MCDECEFLLYGCLRITETLINNYRWMRSVKEAFVSVALMVLLLPGCGRLLWKLMSTILFIQKLKQQSGKRYDLSLAVYEEETWFPCVFLLF